MDELVAQKLKLVHKMISLYCKKQHHTRGLCPQCQSLYDYATVRTEQCRQKNAKTFCAHCPTPCYAPVPKGEMRQVMKFAGPRILLYHPIWVLKHCYQSWRNHYGKTGRNPGKN